MAPFELSPVKELYHLWKPVYPYLARHIRELYGRSDGAIAEIGPFCGSIFALRSEGVGDRFLLATFPKGVAGFFRDEAFRADPLQTVPVIETDPSLTAIRGASLDLVVFRGAFFFPRLFQIDFSALLRVLKRGGMAIAGGGFGKYTPGKVIREMGEWSRYLNLRAGKTEVAAESLRGEFARSPMPAGREVITEGGLWVVVRK
jgi:hypothetical protein